MEERLYVSKRGAALARRIEGWLATSVQFVQFAAVRVDPRGPVPELQIFVGVQKPAPEQALGEAVQALVHNKLLEWDVDDRQYDLSVRARQGTPRQDPGAEKPQVPERGIVS